MFRRPHRWMQAAALSCAVTLAATVPALAATRVLVVPFSAPQEALWQDMGAAAADKITTALLQFPDFEVVSWAVLAARSPVPVRPDDQAAVMALAKAAEADVVVTGDLRAIGDQIELSGRFIKLPGGQIAQATSLAGQRREVFSLHERFTHQFLAANGITPSARQSQQVQQVVSATQIIPAATLYHQGRQAYEKGTVDSYRQAIRHFDEALAADPGYTLALAAKAEAMARMCFIRSHSGQSWGADAQAAKRLAEEAVRRQPYLSEAHQALALSRLVLGEDATDSAKRALELAPNDPEALTLHWMVTKGKENEALAKALEINPWLSLAHNGLGISLLRAGKTNEAIEAFRDAAEANPGDALAHLYLGLALKQTWQTREAIREFRKAISLDRSLALAHYHLGRSLQSQGSLDDAFQAFRDALEADRSMDEARLALTQLRSRMKGEEHERRPRREAYPAR